MKKITEFIKNHRTGAHISGIVFFVLFVNFINIFVVNNDPLYYRFSMNDSQRLVNVPILSNNTIDPNDGITKEALGVQAADQILSGKMPLWNHNEALGSPLLGETQSAALFPLILLFKLPFGWLIFHLILESLAGIGMYLFIHKLLKFFAKSDKTDKIEIISLVAGALFAINPSFFMLSNAVFNPIAFFPWQLFGVLLIFENLKGKFFAKSNLIAMCGLIFSVSLSLLSGFPEIAYANGLLVAIFAIFIFAKKARGARLKFLTRLTIPLIAAVLICLPWVFEFMTFSNPANGFLGGHADSSLSESSFPNSALTYLVHFFPNVIGYNTHNSLFGSIGGAFTLSLLALAVIGLKFKQIPVFIRGIFAGWFVFFWLIYIGFTLPTWLISHIPMMSSIAITRYLTVSMFVCLLVLATFGLMKVLTQKKLELYDKFAFIGALIFGVAVVIFAKLDGVFTDFTSSKRFTIWSLFYILLGLSSVVAIFVALLIKRNSRTKSLIIGGILLCEMLLIFVPWQLGSPSKNTKVDMGAVTFLRKNLGIQRFSGDVIRPNYGSYFGLSQLDYDDLPAAKKMIDFRAKNNMPVIYGGIIGTPNLGDVEYIQGAARAGVKYLVVKNGEMSDVMIKEANLKGVYDDKKTQIFEILNYRKYFMANNCEI